MPLHASPVQMSINGHSGLNRLVAKVLLDYG